MPAKQFRPSVSWEGPGQLGCHLVVMGVCFKNSYLGGVAEPSPELGGIRLGPGHTGQIFQLGNTTADPIGPSNLRGPFLNSTSAVAPASFIRWDPGPRPSGIREPFLDPFSVEPR